MHDNMMNRPDDHEAKMARADLFKLAQYSFKLFKMIGENQELEGWVQAKITKSADYIASVYHYLEYEMKISEFGDHLENAEMYSESVRRAFQQKLTEAKKMAEKAKAAVKKKEKELDEGMSIPQDPDGATAPPPKGKDGQYPIVVSGPNKGKRWSPQTPGPTNPAMKEQLKGGQTKLDVDKDGKLEKSDFAKLRAGKKVKEELSKVGDTKKTATGELTKTAKGVVHKRTDYSDDEHGEAPSTVKQKSAAEKKADKANDIKLPKHKGNTWGMKGGEKFGKKMEGAKPDFLDLDKDGNKKEPMKKALKDKKIKEGGYYDPANDLPVKGSQASMDTVNSAMATLANTNPTLAKKYPPGSLPDDKAKKLWLNAIAAGQIPSNSKFIPSNWGGGKPSTPETAMSPAPVPQKSGIPATAKTTVPGMRANQQDLQKANSSAALGEGKCNHTPKGKKCPVHGLKECGGMYEGDKFNPLKHVKNPTAGEKAAAKDVKRGSYADRAAMLKSAEADGRLKKESTGDYSAKKARAGKDIGKPGKNFAKIAKSAGKAYGSKERGEKVAGAVLAKLRAKG